jgi:hypothetical protein
MSLQAAVRPQHLLWGPSLKENCFTQNRFLMHYQTNMVMSYKEIIAIHSQYPAKPKNK